MNTFLPIPDLENAPKYIDDIRLNKQIVEGYQILKCNIRVLSGEQNVGWRNHKAVRMWRGYESSLFHYVARCAEEWACRGNKQPQDHKSYRSLFTDFGYLQHKDRVDPPWSKDAVFFNAMCSTHRASLLWKSIHKDAERGVDTYYFYRQFNWKEVPLWEYIWPV